MSTPGLWNKEFEFKLLVTTYILNNNFVENINVNSQSVQCELPSVNEINIDDIAKFDVQHSIVRSVLQHIDISLYQFERHALSKHVESIEVQKKAAKQVSRKFKELIHSLDEQQKETFSKMKRQRKVLKLVFFALMVFMFGMLCLGDAGFTDDFTGKVIIVLPVLAGTALFRYGH